MAASKEDTMQKKIEEAGVGVRQIDEWSRCYDDSWQGEIVDEAFAHP